MVMVGNILKNLNTPKKTGDNEDNEINGSLVLPYVTFWRESKESLLVIDCEWPFYFCNAIENFFVFQNN